MVSGNQPSQNVETLIYRKLDIHILIWKGLCATIVAKRDMLRQTLRMIIGGLCHDGMDSKRIYSCKYIYPMGKF